MATKGMTIAPEGEADTGTVQGQTGGSQVAGAAPDQPGAGVQKQMRDYYLAPPDAAATRLAGHAGVYFGRTVRFQKERPSGPCLRPHGRFRVGD